MAYQSLYRKHRPQSFKDVKGQEHITNALAEQIKQGTVGHAYLFAGSRGLGKTSIARIFARELGTSDKDLYEIDAASNNSVDDIRALTENVYTLPFESKYKVYILDEAHMLSKGAWNAFLKTLEEPPAHVIFILATTELSKVPETVQSRCQVYEFMKPSRSALSAHVKHVAEKEGYTMAVQAADLVALLAEGSFRDSLSVLERVLAGITGTEVTRALAQQATGAPTQSLVHAFVAALAEGNADAALRTLRTVSDQGIDANLYLSLILGYVRAVLLIRYAPELRKALSEELGADVYGEAEGLAKASSSKLTHQTLKVLLDAAERMRFTPVPTLPLELAVMELVGHDG